MGQELLDRTGYVRTPRVYYLGVASNGAQVIRGSCDDRYSHAVMGTSPMRYPNELLYGTFHARLDLAKRQLTSNYNWKNKNPENDYLADREWEVVELKKITAKEARQIKKLDSKLYKEWQIATEGKETEQENTNDNDN